MTWIEEYRRSMQMGRGEFAREITTKLGGKGEDRLTVPAGLIYILETHPHPVTHPRLMNLIALACGATKAQRDQFLHKSRRGYPYAANPARRITERPNPWRELPAVKHKPPRANPNEGRQMGVVVVDRTGREVARFKNSGAAAEFMGLTRPSVSSRCSHRIPYEFAVQAEYTCRYADEWDALSPSAQLETIRRAVDASEGRTFRNKPKAVVVVDRQARERMRYASINAAEAGEYVSDDYIRKCCMRREKREFAGDRDITFRFAEQWDGMSRAERLKDVGAG